MPNIVIYGERKYATTKLYFFFWTEIGSLEIQLQESSPTFDKISGSEKLWLMAEKSQIQILGTLLVRGVIGSLSP